MARSPSAAGPLRVVAPLLFVADAQGGGEGGGEHRPQRAAGVAPNKVEREAERVVELEQSQVAVGGLHGGAHGEPDAALRVDGALPVIDYIVEGERPYAGPDNFDEPRLRVLAGRVFDRSNDIAASMTNHSSSIDPAPADARLSQLGGLPMLVLHGTADPMFPPAHGKAIADAIPGARLVELGGIGHQLPPPHTWDLLIDTMIDHTERT